MRGINTLGPIGIAFALAGAALPAHAADLSTLSCVAEKMPILARAQVELDYERNMTESGKPQSFDPMVTEAIKEATTACAAEHGWPAAALQPAALYTRAKLGWGTAQRIAAERGLDIGVLETLWFEEPEEIRNAPLTMETYRALADAAIPEGERRTAANGELVTEYFQTLSIMQYSSFEFSQA